MRRSVSFLVLAAGLATSAFAWGGDKLPDHAALADAREDVSQALLAEVQGNNDQRSKRLTKAWLAVPDLAEANWHMARVRVAGQWKPLAEVVSQSANDADQEQYRTLRDKAAGNPRALRDLARWCAKRDWNDRARLHYAQLLALPNAETSQKSEAVEKLNLVQMNGAWLTKEEFQARQEEVQSIQDSLAKWRPKLKALQEMIDSTDFAKRDRAIAEFEKLDDPAMIPALETFLLDGRADFQEQAVKKLATFKHCESTQALTRYAVLSDYSLTRDAATSALKERPQHEYVPLLLAALAHPLQSQFLLAWDRAGRVAHVHALLHETPSGNLLLVSHQLTRPIQTSSSSSNSSITQTVSRKKTRTPARITTSNIQSARSQIGPTLAEAARDEAQHMFIEAANTQTKVRMTNSQIEQANKRILKTLEATTSGTYAKPSDWHDWWQSFNEYSWPKPTKYLWKSQVSSYHVHQHTHTETTGNIHSALFGPRSCFLAGTPVRTEMGTVPIESIKPGDRVLAQDQDTGELAYKVVLTTTLRPPAKMLQIQAGGEDIHTTLGHPFWVSGQGWRMAKQLNEGDLLHGLGGATPIKSVVAAGEHAAHNLVVDDLNTYFVGQAGLLVHDNEFRKPTRSVVPGLVRD